MNLSTADLRNYRTEFHETWFLVDPKISDLWTAVDKFKVNGKKGE
jgi:hypothetical protein